MGHFYFVRHGQTIWNVENKICGATDIALTEYGHQQAIETGKKILEEGIHADEILYSPLIRAAETARHISEVTGIPARVEPRLIEQNFGKRKRCSPAGTETVSPHFSWPRGFIIFSMISEKNLTKRHIFSWHTTVSHALSSRILQI